METKNQKYRAKAEDLLNELTSVMRSAFIAIYEKEEKSVIMRLVNGQRFRVTVDEL